MAIEEIFGAVLNYLIMLLVLVLWVLFTVRLVKNKYASVKTAKAMVVDKYMAQTVSKTQGTFKKERYIIVFLAEGKKLAFAVPEFSYPEYNVKDKGTLKYKGNKIIDFS